MAVRMTAPHHPSAGDEANCPAPAAFAAAALFVGAVLGLDPGGWSPFGPAKWALTATLALVTVGLALRGGRARLHRRSTIVWAVALGLFGVSALVNDDEAVALLGHPVRHLGWVTWLLFAALFAAGQQLTTAADRHTIARGAVIAGLGMGLYALWELAFGPPIAIASNTSRLTGPFGSAAFLGAAACLLVPISVGVASSRAERCAWRWLGAVAAATGMVALLGSGARAAWLGTAAAGLVLLVRLRPSRKAVFLGGAALVATLAVCSPWLVDVADRSQGMTSRLDEWRVATRVIAHHPLLGTGPEGYRIAVAEGVDRAYERAHPRTSVLPDRAHSGPLDAALAGGVGVALAVVALVLFVCRRAWSAIGRADPTVAGLAVGTIAFAVQQLVLFPVAELDALWWLVAGLLVAATSTTSTVATQHRSRRVLGTVALALAALAAAAGIADVAADRLARRAVDAGSDRDAAVADARRATELRPDDLRYRIVAAQVLSERGTLADVDEALRQARAGLRWSPNDPIVRDQEAALLLQRATITGDPADTAASLDAWRRLTALDPYRSAWQVQLGRAAALAGEVDLARTAWTTAVDLDPADTTAATLLAALDAQTASAADS
jgi:O-antigen ligase/Flp pilus assembly protein TadD